MPLSLHFTKYGQSGPPVLILHGLFGSSRNWASVARALGDEYTVYALDQRNHGDSPHDPSHSLADLRGDLLHFIQEHRIVRPVLLGHSMGGMVAMSLALEEPEQLAGLVVVDIAPRSYEPHHQKEFATLELDVSRFSSRAEIDEAMRALHPSAEVRRFLQTNLKRSRSGFAWKLNVAALKEAAFTSRAKFSGSYEGPALFVTGESSSYVRPEDHDLIYGHFPKATIRTIPGAGHWLHHSHQREFLEIARTEIRSMQSGSWLNRSSNSPIP